MLPSLRYKINMQESISFLNIISITQGRSCTFKWNQFKVNSKKVRIILQTTRPQECILKCQRH